MREHMKWQLVIPVLVLGAGLVIAGYAYRDNDIADGFAGFILVFTIAVSLALFIFTYIGIKKSG